MFVELAILDRFHVSKGPRITMLFWCSKILWEGATMQPTIFVQITWISYVFPDVWLSHQLLWWWWDLRFGWKTSLSGCQTPLKPGFKADRFQVLGICWFLKSDQWIKSYCISKRIQDNMFDVRYFFLWFYPSLSHCCIMLHWTIMENIYLLQLCIYPKASKINQGNLLLWWLSVCRYQAQVRWTTRLRGTMI